MHRNFIMKENYVWKQEKQKFKNARRWERRGRKPSWHTLPVTGIDCTPVDFTWVQGEGVQQCMGKQRQAAKRNGQQPRPGGLWESKEMFQVVWKRSVMRVLTAASLSWTHQSTHIEENRRQQEPQNFTGQKAAETHRLPLCCTRELQERLALLGLHSQS